MEINWFPGHMARSTREIENNLKISDAAIYVLDCRAVRSCFNPKFDGMIDIPVVYVLNKADTVTSDITSDWIEFLSDRGLTALAIDGTNSACKKKLTDAIRTACKATLERQKIRGLNEHLRCMVVGVPNTGKSTIINTLCGKAGLTTGNRAGVTKSAVWARVDNTLDVLDTPGTLYPKISDRTVGENLAIIGSIKDEVIDTAELATALIDRLNSIDTGILAARYGTEIGAENGLTDIAQKRGYKMRGGELDTERAAASIIDDYRKGRLGKIALERARV